MSICQEFFANDDRIRQINLIFDNEHFYEAEGTVTIKLEDQQSNILVQDSLEANELKHKTKTTFDFVFDSSEINTNHLLKMNRNETSNALGVEVTKGDKYSLTIETHDWNNKNKIYIYAYNDSKEEGTRLTINGNEYPQGLLFSVSYTHFPLKLFLELLLLLLCSLLIVFIPWRPHLEKLVQQAILCLQPFISFWCTCKTADESTEEIFAFITTPVGLLNILILLLLTALLYLLTNRAKIAALTNIGITFLFVTANYFLEQFRGSPLSASDFADFGTAMDVVGNYHPIFGKAYLITTVVLVVFFAVSLSIKQHKGLSLRYRIGIFIPLVICLFVMNIFISTPTNVNKYELKVNAFYPTKSYKRLGYPLAFALSCKYAAVDKPSGYSIAAVEQIASDYKSDHAVSNAKVSESSPNIIVIMNEAYADLSYLGELNTSQPYMPFFDSIKDNAIKGRMYTSVFGGGTANTEFEFLTGDSIAFLRYRTPYSTLIRDNMPSLATTLRDQGYGGLIAFHPGAIDSYKRNIVYPYLGFAKHISIDDLESPKTLRAFVSDEGDYETVISEYEHFRDKELEKPFFLFNVTIQNHSSFKYTSGIVDEGIVVEDHGLNYEEVGQYLNLIKNSDEAFEKLLKYYSSVEEPTIIVMFGDHQPKVETAFYDEMRNRLPKDLSTKEKDSLKFQVPFIIWANFDIPEENNVQISANMLHSYMLDKLKMRMTGYDKYLVNYHKQIPVLTRSVKINSAGNMSHIDIDDLQSDTDEELLREYSILQYNHIKNSADRLDDFFYLIK